MKGIIETAYHNAKINAIAYIFICGEDGQIYFGHRNDFKHKSKHYKKGRTVTFDVEDNGHAHPDAVNIDVEIPVDLSRAEELLSIEHLQDGAYIKRIRKGDGTEITLIIKDNRLVISCLPEYERDMIWMYRRGPSGRIS